MGKLHKIRRQILKDPSKWKSAWADSAYLKDGVWTGYSSWRGNRSYSHFVKHVKNELDSNGGW